LAPALQAAGDGAVQVLFLPNEDQRRVVEEVMPAMPALSILPAKTLARGLRWAALGMELNGKLTLRFTAQAADASAAEKISSLIRLGLAALGRQVLIGEEKPLIELLPAEFRAATAALSPSVAGDRVTVTIDDSDKQKAVATVAAFAAERYETGGFPSATKALKWIGLAMHNFQSADKEHRFPPAAIFSKDGKPLLSWRVAILPYVEQEYLYQQFHLDEPWDSEHNKKLIPMIPPVYRNARIRDGRPGLTTYLVPVGKEVAFTGEPKGRVFPGEFPDGTANTIMVVDVADEKGVIWTKPDDLVVDLNDPKKGLMGHYPAYFLAGFADGSVRAIPKNISRATLRGAFTVAGGETLYWDRTGD
jgi:hypothetical protein